MKKSTFLFFILFSINLLAQNNQDTTVYQIVDKQASFPGCDYSWYSEKEKDSCRMSNLMNFLRSNLRYPDDAKEKNISGRVVVKFIVEKDGQLSNISVLKDIGAGCGNEALRIINGMNQMNIRWNPGTLSGNTVRSQMVLPMNFKLEEDPGYRIIDGYPVFYLFEKPLTIKDSTLFLNAFLQKNLELPAFINDSCKAGVIQTEILVLPDGTAKCLQLDDYSNLGVDAQFEAIQAVTKTAGIWSVAEYKGKPVPTSVPARVIFKPNVAKCKTVSDNFEKAYTIMQEAVELSDKKELEPSLLKMTSAVNLMPNNMEFLYLRGVLNMNLNKLPEACADLTKVKTTLNVNWVDELIPLMCR